MALTWKDYTLDEAAVEEISGTIQTLLSEREKDRRKLHRVRLTAEELLLRIRDAYPEPVDLSVGIGKQYGRLVLRLRYGGDSFDPTERGGDDDWSYRILSSLGLTPAWSYRGRTNTVTMTLRERSGHGTLFYILLALALAVVLGVAGRLLFPALGLTLNDILLTPLMNTFLGLLNTFAGIMIAFTICSGVLGMGDPSTLRSVGKGMLLRFALLTLVISAACLVISSPLLHLHLLGNAETGGTSQAGQLIAMIFNIFPTNSVNPFLNGNTMQIIVIAIFVGVGLLALGERGVHLRTLAEEGALLTQRLTSFVCKLVPIFVFAALLRLIWAGEAAVLISLWKPLCLLVVLVLAVTAVMLLVTAVQVRCSPLLLLKKVAPPLLIGLSTASSMSAFTSSMETCENKLGMDSALLKFAYPVGSVMFMPATAAYFSVVAISFAALYDVPITAAWLVMACITVTLLTIAVPPIPGAGLMVYSVIFAQLGIPAEAMLLAATLDIVSDFVITGFNIGTLLLEMTREAEKMHKIDRTLLLKKL